MSASRTHLGHLLLALLVSAAAAFGPYPAVGAGEPPARLALVVYITTSKACGCTLELCQAGDNIIQQIFADGRGVPLERLDHGRDPEAAKGFIMDYRLFTLPALLFLDSRGNLVARWQGLLPREEILAKLKEYSR